MSQPLRSALFGGTFSVKAARKLKLDFVRLTVPWHQNALRGEYGQIPEIGLPVWYQLSDLRVVHTSEQIAYVLNMPNLAPIITIGNEWDLAWENYPAQTPEEYVDFVVANMQVILPQILKQQKEFRFVLSLGSKGAFDTGVAETMLKRLNQFPNISKLFSAAGINYYALPLHPRQCVNWLKSLYAMLGRVGWGKRTLILKEVGCPMPHETMADAVNFIPKFFQIVEKQNLTWLEAVEWYAANDLSALGLPYVPLIDGEKLTPAGELWAQRM